MAAVELQRMITAAGGPPSDDPAQQQERDFNTKYGLTDDVLSMVYGVNEYQRRLPGGQTQFEILKEESYGTSHIKSRIKSHLQLDGGDRRRHMLICQLGPGSPLAKTRGLGYVSSRLASCYWSSLGMGMDEDLLVISLSLAELQSVELAALDIDFVADLQPFHQPIHFSYNFRTGHSVYLLCNVRVPDLTAVTYDGQLRLHPFSIHLALLQQGIMARVDSMVQGLADMLKIERRLLDDPFPELISLDVLRKDIQTLHIITRSFILAENRASRNLSNVNSLLLDLNRLKVQTESHQEYVQLDAKLNERMLDGFLSLRESCTTILRRLKNRRERISNHIQLLYNLRADRDSQEIRGDAAAMRTMATLTILFLPTTFLGSAFAIATSQGSTGLSAFAVSNMWWIYLLSVVSLTLVTIGLWMWCLRRRKRDRVGDSRGV